MSGRRWFETYCRHCRAITAHRVVGGRLDCASCHPPKASAQLELAAVKR